MDLVTVMVADYAQKAEHGKINVMGIFGEIFAPRFPARHGQMYLVMTFSASSAESDQKRTITVRLMSEDGRAVLPDLKRDINVPAPKAKGAPVGIEMIFSIQGIIFPTAGTYQFSVLVDNDEKGSLPVRLTEGLPSS